MLQSIEHMVERQEPRRVDTHVRRLHLGREPQLVYHSIVVEAERFDNEPTAVRLLRDRQERTGIGCVILDEFARASQRLN